MLKPGHCATCLLWRDVWWCFLHFPLDVFSLSFNNHADGILQAPAWTKPQNCGCKEITIFRWRKPRFETLPDNYHSQTLILNVLFHRTFTEDRCIIKKKKKLCSLILLTFELNLAFI